MILGCGEHLLLKSFSIQRLTVTDNELLERGVNIVYSIVIEVFGVNDLVLRNVLRSSAFIRVQTSIVSRK